MQAEIEAIDEGQPDDGEDDQHGRRHRRIGEEWHASDPAAACRPRRRGPLTDRNLTGFVHALQQAHLGLAEGCDPATGLAGS